jgi:long-chain acyl-CoA synthetase
MREYSTPPLDQPYAVRGRSAVNLADDVLRRAQEEPDAVVASRRTPGGWEPVTARRLADDVTTWAWRFVSAGLAHGDRVALLSRTRYEWTVADYAAWMVGCVVVPLYETSAAEQIAFVLRDSGARAVLVETPTHAEVVAGAREDLPALDHLWALVDEAGVHDACDPLPAAGPVEHSTLDARRDGVDHATAATLVYTSGSTGTPRGCRLDHGHLLFGSAATADVLGPVLDADDAATLLFLPLAHVLARLVQVTALRAGVRLGYAADMRTLVDDLEEFRPTFLVGVPRVFEKLFTVYSQRAAADGRGALFDRAADTAIAWSQALEGPRGPGPVLRARHAAFERLVYRRMREALGGRLSHAVAGGAPLGDRLGHVFRGAGIPVLEGYGLTETTGGTTATTPGDHKVGRVGRPLPGTSVRVSGDGELLVRGPHVFTGYWQDDEATAEALTADGWFRTGDLGEIDDEGFVRVTGRLREILVTAGGKNVSPGPLEDAVRAHPLVDQCLVVGDARPYVAAVLTLDGEAARAWARSNGRPTDLDALTRDEDLLAELQVAVDRANDRVSQAESIRRWAVVAGEWTEESGELTPSLKLRRHVVSRRHRAVIDDLYLP